MPCGYHTTPMGPLPPSLGRFPAKQFQGLPANTQHSSEPPQTPRLWSNPTTCRGRPTSSGRMGPVSRTAIMEGKGPSLLRVAPTRRSITTYQTVEEDTKGLRSSHARRRSTPMPRENLSALVLLVPSGRYAALFPDLDEREPDYNNRKKRDRETKNTPSKRTND